MSNVFTKQNALKSTAICTERIAALQADVPAKTQIPINGTLTPVAQVIATYQDALDQQTALAAKRKEVSAAIVAKDAAFAACQATDAALEAWVVNQFGAGSSQAMNFGFAPKKPRAVSAAVRALGIQKGQDTRAANKKPVPKVRLTIAAGPPAAPTANGSGPSPSAASNASSAAVTPAPQPVSH